MKKQINLSSKKSIINYISNSDSPYHIENLYPSNTEINGVKSKKWNFHFEGSYEDNKGKQPTTTKGWLKKLNLLQLLPIQDRLSIGCKSIPECDSFNVYVEIYPEVKEQKHISIGSVDDVVAERGKMIDTDNVAITIYLAGDDNRTIATGQYNIRTDYAHITLETDRNVDFKPLEDKYDDEAEVIINNSCEHSGFTYINDNCIIKKRKLRIPLT